MTKDTGVNIKRKHLAELTERVLGGRSITEKEASFLASDEIPIHSLFEAASCLREHYRGKKVDLCSIVNAKSGGCSEDCSYCAQSARYSAEIDVYPLIKKEEILQRAEEAREAGAKRFCIVTSGRKASPSELDEIVSAIRDIRKIGLLPCATIGLLNRTELETLKEAGLERFHHNLESSEEFFRKVCSTHTYEDKLRTILAAKSAGLSLCSGGIFGMGESWQDRIKMAFTLKDLDIDSVPINFLIPVRGTPMERMGFLNPLEALRIVCIYRFILPDKEIRLCGGRIQTLGEFNSMVFLAGADSLLIGNYLTQKGRTAAEDLNLIRSYSLEF
jgi:biotin synthase